jgi:hypothetical protein
MSSRLEGRGKKVVRFGKREKERREERKVFLLRLIGGSDQAPSPGEGQ